VRPLQGDPPKRFAQKFIPLPAMELMQKIVEISGRRNFVAL